MYRLYIHSFVKVNKTSFTVDNSRVYMPVLFFHRSFFVFWFPWSSNIWGGCCILHLPFDNSKLWIYRRSSCLHFQSCSIIFWYKQFLCNACILPFLQIWLGGLLVLLVIIGLRISQVLIDNWGHCTFPNITGVSFLISLEYISDNAIRIKSTTRPKNWIFCVGIKTNFSRFFQP